MTYIITRLCRDCLDTGCVAVCPVDCIYEYTGSDHDQFPNQLYIHPDECIDCGACEPECPWQAIFEEVAVAGVFLNNKTLKYPKEKHTGKLKKYQHKKNPPTTPHKKRAHKKKSEGTGERRGAGGWW